MNNYIITVSKSDLWRSNASLFRRHAGNALERLVRANRLQHLVGPAGTQAGPIYPADHVDWLCAAIHRVKSEDLSLNTKRVTIALGQFKPRRVIAGCEHIFDLKDELISYRGCGGLTMLHYAVLAGNEPLSRFLAEEVGVSANVVDDYGCSPLHYAAAVANGNFEVVDLLTEFGADMALRNNQGLTPDSFALSPELSKRHIGASVASIQCGAAEKAGRRM